MIIRHILSLGIVVMLSVSLTACFGHDNPLKKMPPKQSAQFLVSASQYAEKALKVFQTPGGGYYGQCMMGKQKTSLCNKLYTNMVTFAKKTPGFKSITVSDLTNKSVWNVIKPDYQQQQFDAV